MNDIRKLWLITNAASGSNNDAAIDAIEHACGDCGLMVARHIGFPDEPLPVPAVLDDAGIDLVAIFAGDGTLNAAIDALAGWGGQVLVLPGGTMNLLYHRLFGDLPLAEALVAVGQGLALARRPGVISSPLGHAYAGLLAGPGTVWNHVREAMRSGNIMETASEVGAALTETINGAMIACVEPLLGRSDGYPLLMLTPEDDALELIAYHAETTGEFLQQAAALAQRDFRLGPHEVLARGDGFVFACPEGAPFGVLLDGEPAESSQPVRFSLARCEVDLLATCPDG